MAGACRTLIASSAARSEERRAGSREHGASAAEFGKQISANAAEMNEWQVVHKLSGMPSMAAQVESQPGRRRLGWLGWLGVQACIERITRSRCGCRSKPKPMPGQGINS